MANTAVRIRITRWSAVCILLCFLCAVVCVPAHAAETGQALYTARFDGYASLRDTGMHLGTASGTASVLQLKDGDLCLAASGGEKAYLLMPDVAVTADTYVIEFAFRFSQIASSNGYLGFLLSSQGDAPSGRTEMIFRVNGAVDGYSAKANETVQKAAASGEVLTVRILVYYGYMMDFRLLVSGETAVSGTPSRLVQVNPAGWGFVLRNAAVSMEYIRAVSGNYEALAQAADAPNYIAPADWQMPELSAPPTGDGMWLYTVVCALTAAAAKRLRKK